MTTPLLAPDEVSDRTESPLPEPSAAPPSVDKLAKPYRLGLVGLGAAIGLFARLAAANGFGDLDSDRLMLGAAATSAIMGLGLLMIAAERDRFGLSLAWITAVTAAAWGTLNWVSPPFAEAVTVWSRPDQAVLAVLGAGNGLLLAGIVALAFVRRAPTLTVAATLIAGVCGLAANTVLLRAEWPSIITLGVGFAFVLLAWDRSPRREKQFTAPPDSPRVSRAALSFMSVALSGTAIQLWVSRSSIPRSTPAIIAAVLLIAAAFASMIRVRREIERRDTSLSEWTSWMREIRTNDFRSEMQNFESPGGSVAATEAPVGFDGEAPRKLSFPNLTVTNPDTETPADTGIGDIGPSDLAAAAAEMSLPMPDRPADPPTPEPFDVLLPTADPAPSVAAPVPDIILPTADVLPAAASGAFSSVLAGAQPTESQSDIEIADLDALAKWLDSPAASARVHPLLVAVEAMSLDEFESLSAQDSAMARDEIGSFLADTMPTADLVSWIDGPYFIVAHASKPTNELTALHRRLSKTLRSTDGMLAFIRPGPEAELDDLVNEAVMGLLHARRNAQ